MTESKEVPPTPGTPELQAKITRRITNIPEKLSGTPFKLQKGEVFDIKSSGLQGYQARILVYGGADAQIGFDDLRELLGKKCQIDFSMGVSIPPEDAGKSVITYNGIPLTRFNFVGEKKDKLVSWFPPEEGIANFKQTLEREDKEGIENAARISEFKPAPGMEKLFEKLKEGKVDSANLNRRTGGFASTREILDENPKVRNDLAEILCRFGDLKYYPHSDSHAIHVIPMLADGVKKESIISVLEKGVDADPEAWGNILDYFDSRDYMRRSGKKINRETELNYYKYETIIEGGFYIMKDPKKLFKMALESTTNDVEKDSMIRFIFVRLGYDDSGTLVGRLRDWNQDKLFKLENYLVKAIVDSDKSLADLNKMNPATFLVNDVPEIKAVAEAWKEKGNSDYDIAMALGNLSDYKKGDEGSVLDRFSKIPIPKKSLGDLLEELFRDGDAGKGKPSGETPT